MIEPEGRMQTSRDEVLKIIQKGESETAEFKESFDRETIETASAFANTKGGVVLVGVSDAGEIRGAQMGKESLRDWANKISQGTEPRVIPEIEIGEINGKNVVIIRVREFPIKPVSVKGRYLRRVGNSNRVMTAQEIAQAHFNSAGMSWDRFPARGATVEDIDLEKVKRCVKKADETGRRKVLESEDPLQVLKKLELIAEGKPTWAAVLLFGKEVDRFLSQAVIHCGRFKDETEVIDNRIVEGAITEQLEEAMDFIRKNISVRFVMTGKPAREEIWDYPLEALREAIINAVCHRDYTIPSNTDIRIYDDALIIWNPGGLPSGITMEELYKPHSSVLRNKGVGGIFYDMGLIEQWGSGIEKMREACMDAKLPEPIFEEYQGGFRVIFRKDMYREGYLQKLGLNERQIRAVAFVRERKRITNKEYQEINDCSRNTASTDLRELVERGILKESGKKGAGSFYTIAQ